MQTIEITTSQNVTIEYELAPLIERFWALLLDNLIMIIVWLALVFTLFDALSSNKYRAIQQILFTFPFWFTIIYNFVCETLLRGQTMGKKVMKIKVVRIDGKKLGATDYFLRSIFQLVDYFFTLGILGAVLISSSDRKQRMGDMAAGTAVIRLSTDRRFTLSSILNIQTIDSHTPLFPEVKNLSEEDMLFIKSVVLRRRKYPNNSHKEVVENLYVHIRGLLKLDSPFLYHEAERIEFFQTLIKDYIVLTR
jgi:uncharacterized RDD family membrane protein YckC